jgi:hypothetical protein
MRETESGPATFGVVQNQEPFMLDGPPQKGAKVGKKWVSRPDYGFEIAGTLSPNHPLYVNDSMGKSRHSTGKKEGLCVELKIATGITALCTMTKIYGPSQLLL